MQGYFDANATAPLAAVAREAWLSAQEHLWANPSGPTAVSARARNFLREQREAVADVFAVDPERVIFTSGATEGNNAVCQWMARLGAEGGCWVRSPFEHPSVAEPFAAFAPGEAVILRGTSGGIVDLEEAANALRKRPVALLSVLAASNETGVIQPTAQLAGLARERGARIHCDAVQWIGRGALDQLPDCDFLTVSGHKFGAPKGVGCLLLGPEMGGFTGAIGGGQEFGRRAGTEDLAGIAAMVAALRAVVEAPLPSSGGRDLLAQRLKSFGARILGEGLPRLPQTLAVVLPRYDRTRWIARLDRRGFSIGAGAACSTGKEGPSPTLRAMGLSADEAARTVRVSGLREASHEDWSALTEAFEAVLEDLDNDRGDERLTTVIEIP